jgi:molybdenum cofactor cytidylyltransferase
VKFGDVSVEDAEGAILAHTARLLTGVLKKGRRLSAEDVERLRAEGTRSVIAAQLEPGDVGEDEAARRLAEAMAGDGVRVAEAATGRANLYATRRGLLRLDRARLEAFNAVDEALTLATAKRHKLVERGDIVATVKIIPFGVPDERVVRAMHALGAPPLLSVAALKEREAGLVLTTLPGVADSQLDLASRSQHARLRFLGGQIASERRCAHETSAVAREIRALCEAGCDPILLLGASAIVDRRDVLPRAVEEAGGTVEHLGMPVDPGNLLLLGRCDGRVVIGVPGCARSLKRSGFDQVLERVVAGLPVTTEDIATMGEGGLLKEDPERPHPRRGRLAARAPAKFAAVLLAAGESRRMGEANKLLERVDGIPMVARVVAALKASRASQVVVITGHEHDRVREALADHEVRFVHNPDYAQGMSTSVRAGIDALGEDVDAALFALGDMPWIQSGHIDALLAAFDPEVAPICVPVFDRKRGNPVLWSSRYFPQMRALTGDVGARRLLSDYAEDVRLVHMSDAAVLIDVDTPEALAGLRSK